MYEYTDNKSKYSLVKKFNSYVSLEIYEQVNKWYSFTSFQILLIMFKNMKTYNKGSFKLKKKLKDKCECYS